MADSTPKPSQDEEPVEGLIVSQVIPNPTPSVPTEEVQGQIQKKGGVTHGKN